MKFRDKINQIMWMKVAVLQPEEYFFFLLICAQNITSVLQHSFIKSIFFKEENVQEVPQVFFTACVTLIVCVV